jgi:hypothetical protein
MNRLRVIRLHASPLPVAQDHKIALCRLSWNISKISARSHW